MIISNPLIWIKNRLGGRDVANPKNDRVLLVGLNAYPGAPLNGCRNDIHDMNSYLLNYKHFCPESIHMLEDKAGTTVNILNELKWLTGTPAGNRAVFVYSGHGAQVKAPLSVEPDGFSEVICPIDFDWSPDRMITDKQFVALFSLIVAGVNVSWTSDSCHSGDLDRGINKNRITPRLYPLPSPHKSDTRKLYSKSKAMANGRLALRFISGCQSNQTSADAFINGRYNGAMTYYLLKSLRMLNNATTRQAAERVNNELRIAGYDQRPQAEGEVDQIIFG